MARPKREEMKRKPAGMPRKKLVTDGLDPNFKYYYAKEDQFQELIDAGYVFETNNSDITTGDEGKEHPGSRVSVPASRSTDEKLYLMKIRKDWYQENQKTKQRAIDEQEREMFNRGDTEKTYTVKGTRKDSQLL